MTDTPNTTQGKGAFQVGDKVRYIGPERVGLTPGAIYDCIRVGSFNAPIHFDDDGDARDRTENDYELVSRAEHPTPTHYAPELVERMVALCRHAAVSASGHTQEEARSILSDLPQEVDPDLIEARDCVVKAYEAAGRKDLAIVAASGKMDGRLRVQAAKLAIVRGRQLERGDAA